MKKNIGKKIKKANGITLVALVVTLIVLLILASVSLSVILSETGIFSKSEKAGTKYNEAKAREVLETVLLADGQYEKNTNPQYNQDDFLNTLITTQIPSSSIIEGSDVVVIEEKYAFELDRSVPKIGRYLENPKNLVFPKVEIIIEPTIISNGREAKFTAKATENTKGINKIELWLDGKLIDKYTKTYETPQTEIIKEFIVNKNGTYTVKAYADLMGSKKTTVEGSVQAVSFSPNGSEKWQKQHTTQIIVDETGETINEMKYVWIKDDGVNAPVDNLFITDCLNNREVIGGNDTMTGQYYLWVMITIGAGDNIKTIKYSSSEFNFDNEGPTVSLMSSPTSETSFTLTATASDNYNEILKYEFYVDNLVADAQTTVTTTAETATYIWNGTEMQENKVCYVIAYDKLGNHTTASINDARTKLYKWQSYEMISPAEYKLEGGYKTEGYTILIGKSFKVWDSLPTINTATGEFVGGTYVDENHIYKANEFKNKYVQPRHAAGYLMNCVRIMGYEHAVNLGWYLSQNTYWIVKVKEAVWRLSYRYIF